MLNTRAAKQMLIYQAPYDFNNQAGTSLHSAEYVAFYTAYSQLGDLQNCETYLSSNGSALGGNGSQMVTSSTAMSPGDELLKIDFDNSILADLWLSNINTQVNSAEDAITVGAQALGIGSLVLLSTQVASGNVNFRLNALPNYSNDNVRIYKGSMQADILNIPLVWTYKVVKVKQVYPYDTAPGGFFDIPIQIDLNTVPALDFAINNGNIALNMAVFGYVPTFSGLDLPNNYKIDPYADLSNLNLINSLSTANRTVSSKTPSPYGDFFGNSVMQNNTLHIRFYNRNSRWLLYQLVGNNNVNNNYTLSTHNFNFGEGNYGSSHNFENNPFKKTSSRIDELSHITSNGKVFINKSNRIGFITQDNGAYTVLGTQQNPTHFVVSVKVPCDDDNKSLLVDNGGLIYIGEGENQTGDLHLMDGVTLTIGNGGSLYIKPNSKLIVHPGAKLIFENGSTIVNEGEIELLGKYDSDTDQWDAGVLEYNTGVNLIMANTDSEIHFNGGDLLVKENTTFTFTHVNGPSGQLRFSKWGPHVHGEPNSKISLYGDGWNDALIVIDDNADFWNDTPDDLYLMILQQGKVVMGDNARFVATQRLTTASFNYISTTTNRGVVCFDNTTISNANLENVKINAIQVYRPNARLTVINSTFNYTNSNPNTDNVIRVEGKKYSINNSTFTTEVRSIVESLNLTETSYVTNSTFNGVTFPYAPGTGIKDNSNAELIVKGSDFNDLNSCIEKANGKLKARCNNFNDFYYNGIYARDNCYLDLSANNGSGYNQFKEHNYQDPTPNIALSNAQYILLTDGHNYFDDHSYKYVAGTVQIPANAKQHINARKNLWGASGTFVPSANMFNISSSLSGLNISVVRNDPQGGSCGQYDGGGVIISKPNGVNVQATAFINTPNFGQIKMGYAIESVIKETELSDNLKDDLIALALFKEILTYDFGNMNKQTRWYYFYAIEYMKQTLQHTFESGKISKADNSTSFHSGVQNYVDVLNYATEGNITNSNYRKMFNLEMDKVHLFHMIGNYEKALDIIYNMENCAVGYDEQKHINHWKYQLEVEQAKINYGYEAEFIDTVWVDTLNYVQPIAQNHGNFGSKIMGHNSVNFFDCNVSRSHISDDSQLQFTVYPNPSNGIFNVEYNLPEESSGEIVIYSVDGKEIFRTLCYNGNQSQRIDVSSIEKGIYIYSYVVDGVESVRGKVIIQ